ncbi:hypothetical protein DXG01_014312 [Tephrocybe rancida]|nr:hypothetical protein DXG01_014312 [Tephrocybe rancida]
MKFISFASLSISVISLVLPAALAVSHNAQKVINYIDDAEPTDLSPACFWSGKTKVYYGNHSVIVKAEASLDDWRKDIKCHLITEVVSKAKVKDSDLTLADWKDISRRFAGAVSGQVYVLLGKEIRKDSVWLKDEAPALKANKEVTGIEVWEIDTDGKIKKTSKVQDQAALDVSDKAKIVINYLHSAKPDLLNPACFYSGRTGGRKALDYVHHWAGILGFNCHLIFNIVETAQARTGVDPNSLGHDDWKVISREFARVVSGQVYVLLGKEVRQDSVWVEDEAPTLMENEDVLNIEVWEIQADWRYKKMTEDLQKITGPQDEGYIQSRIGWDRRQGQYVAHL